MSIPGTPTGGPFGKNALIYHDELLTTEIGQISTQFDGPGHIGVNTSKGPMMYNGRITWDNYERGAGGRVMGMGPMGVEHVGENGFVCRLVVLDAVAYRKSKGQIPASAEMLPIPKDPKSPGIVTADDVKGMVKAMGIGEIGPGDCVALHTGQGNTWGNGRYKSLTSEQRAAARAIFAQGEPGFGISACEYMASRDIALQMGDTSANDAQPFGEQGDGYAVPCHTQTADPPRHLEPGKRGYRVAGQGRDQGRRVRLGAAAHDRRHRLARQPGRAVLTTRTKSYTPRGRRRESPPFLFGVRLFAATRTPPQPCRDARFPSPRGRRGSTTSSPPRCR